MNDSKPDRWFDERVEAFVDEALPDNELRMFSARLALDSSLRTEVARAARLRQALAATPRLKCPREVPRRVLEITAHRPSLPPRWGWAAAAAVVLAVTLMISVRGPSGVVSQPSAAALAQARADVAVALAYLDRAGAMAGREVGDQWVNGGIVRPVSAGLNHPAHSSRQTEEASG